MPTRAGNDGANHVTQRRWESLAISAAAFRDVSQRLQCCNRPTIPSDRGAIMRCHTFAFRGNFFYYVEQMPRGDSLGTFEQMVLIALIRLGANAYGMTVRREIEERTGRTISIGAVYATLERLEAKGFVSSFTGEPTAERGGRSKRFFRIESHGERALRASQDAIRKMTAGLKSRWGTA